MQEKHSKQQAVWTKAWTKKQLDQTKSFYSQSFSFFNSQSLFPKTCSTATLGYCVYSNIYQPSYNFIPFEQDYLCQGVHSVHETSADHFRIFIKRLAPGLEVRTRQFYSSLIKEKFSQQRSILKKKLEQATWVCTTADCWSSRRKQFLGLTVHWINEDLIRQSACLAIRRVNGKCDYEFLAKLLEEIYEEFDISAKITATVTDNGSNFAKAFWLFSRDKHSIDSSTASRGSHSIYIKKTYSSSSNKASSR